MLILDKVHRLLRRRVVLGGGRAFMRVVGGRRVHLYDVPGRGAGPTIVLVHGLGASANTWSPILFALRAQFRRILVPDLVGHGFTPLEPGEPPLDADGHLAVLKQFVHEVAGEPVVLVGNSLGGGLCVQFAIDEPGMVRGLCLLSPAGAPLGDAGLSSLRDGFAAPTAGAAVAQLARMFHRQSIGTWIVARDFREHFSSPVIHHVLARATGAEQIDAVKLSGALEMPIAFVWGESDRLLPENGWGFYTSHLPPHARTELFAACGHLPHLEQTGRTLAVLDGLARQIESVAAPLRMTS